MNKKIFKLLYGLCCVLFSMCYALSDQERAQGFVYLHEIDSTILVSLRYLSHENFVGSPINGYIKPVVIMTRQAVENLKKVQELVQKDGYSLVIYDAYRPQKAVDHFVTWSTDELDQLKKTYYYPNINKADVFDLGYVSKHSGHSRGSTVDLTLIKNTKKLHEVVIKKRTLLDGSSILVLDDGTLDMGSSFDFFGEVSHTDSKLIEEKYAHRRNYLRSIMEMCGFKNYFQEWWHFTLVNEPFPAQEDGSYFDFDIE